MGLFQEFVDELKRAYIQWELEYRQNARLAKLALTTWWDGLWARMPEVDWQSELDEFQAEWLERGIRINAADAERMRAYLRDWQAESQKRADQRRRAEEAAALQFDQAQPLADGGVAIPFNAALAEQIADQRWYELLAQIAQLIYRYSPPEAWVGEAERIVSVAGAPPKWRRWFIEQIERAQRWRLERDRRPKEWLDAFAEAEHERRRAEAELDRQRESRLWRFAKAIDEYVASGSPVALVAVFRELIDALPDQLPSALIGGEAQQLLQSAQRLLHSVADFIEALPPEAAAVGLDLLQLVLDLVGLIPGFGEPADAINAAISFRRREYLDAALSAASVVPAFGVLPVAGKIWARLARLRKLVDSLTGAARKVLTDLVVFVTNRVRRALADPASLRAVPDELSEKLVELSTQLQRTTRGGATSQPRGPFEHGTSHFFAHSPGAPSGTPRSTALVPTGAIPLGKWGEARLKQILGGAGHKPTKPLVSDLGTRYPDRLVGRIAHEAKAGIKVKLTPKIRKQAEKDAELVRRGTLEEAHWHFFQGADEELLSFLRSLGIRYTVH